MGDSIDYRGRVKRQEEIPAFLNEDFGLVWDGRIAYGMFWNRMAITCGTIIRIRHRFT